MRVSRGSSSAYALFLGVVLLPVVVQLRGVVVGRVFAFEDVTAYFEPLWTAAARALGRGHLASWASGAWSGQPLLGDPQIGLLYPPHWPLWLVTHPLHAYAVSVLLHSVWAAWGAYGLGRALGRSRPAAATSALALALSAYFVLETRHLMFLASAAWVPWLLWAIVRRLRDEGGLAPIAFAFAFALLAGGWSMLVFAAPVVAVFVCTRARSARALFAVVLALGLGAALAAPQLLPALVHARLSPRALPLDAAFASSYAWPSLRYAVTLVAPRFYGDDALGTYRGAPDQWELCGYGAGLVVGVFVALSVRRKAGRTERLLLLSLVALAMLLALGDRGPLWALWRRLPLVGRARCPARVMFVYTIVAPLLAADGVDWLRARFRRGARWAALAPLAVALELLLTFHAENPTVPLATTRLAPEVLSSVPKAPSEARCLIDVHLGQRFHNAGLAWDIESAGGYSSLPLWRYLHFLWIANHGDVYEGPLARDLTAQGLWTLSSPLVDLLGVRWLLAPPDHPPAGTGWSRVRRGADGVDLWRNDEALPRAFVAYGARIATDDATAARMLPLLDDPGRLVVVEQPVDLPSDGGPPTSARMIARDDGEVRFAASARAPGVLVFAEPHEPSWTVTIDGAPASLLRVDYALMGVRLGRGDHEVRFRRIDRPLYAGAWIALGSLAVLVAAGWRARRR